MTSKHSDIMIVDDDPANLRLLESMLSHSGHEVHSFPRGRMALAAASKNPPDLILLDVNMPEMDGYEVCARLKSVDIVSGVPIIFLSALDSAEDKLKAFRSGAADYISKPFHFEEVDARVRMHLALHESQKLLKADNERLERAVQQRTAEIAEANRRLASLDRSKNEFLALISHEFRTPLNGLLGVGDLLLDGAVTPAEIDELRELHDRSRKRILSILDDALLLTQINVSSGGVVCEPVSLANVLDRAVANVAETAAACGIAIGRPAFDPQLVLGDEQLLVRAFAALLGTEVKFGHPGEHVRWSQDPDGGIWFAVMGHGIPGDLMAKFFDPLAISESSTRAGDIGLGPAVASRILTLFGGSVAVGNTVPEGIRFSVTLQPVAS